MIRAAKHTFRAALSALRRRNILSEPWRVVVPTLVVAIAMGLQVVLFGYGATRGGGQLGRFLDNAVRRSMFERAVIVHEQGFLKLMGYPLPALAEKDANKVGVHVLLNSWLADAIVRAKRRRDAVEQNNIGNECSLHIIQPNLGEWFRPIEWQELWPNGTNDAVGALVFDDEHIEEIMTKHFEQVYTSFYQRANVAERVQLFGFAAVYLFGGIFISPDIRDAMTLERVAPGLQSWIEQSKIDCQPAMWFQSIGMENVAVLAATPKHPKIKCVIGELLADEGSGGWRSVIRLMEHSNWDPTCEPRCCPIQNLSKQSSDVFISSTRGVLNDDTPRFQVAIKEKRGKESTILLPKRRCSDRLRNRWCSAGWLCNRCLRMPFTGSLTACRFVCRSCYGKNVCVARDDLKEVTMEVSVKERRDSSQKRIPRIVHQTWFEGLTPVRYPHFQRMQNSWRSSGWDYRFYTDDECEKYIERNYPQRFADAYAAIIPGAFKADLFRLLVLFKDGGIYSDFDVQLDADLDNFVTKDLSFFVPRDVPLDYWPNSNYCLWNGLLGAAPGNPIIAKAIEDVLTTVLNRADYYDVEGSLCARDRGTSIWKLRTLPILILTGPCALGMSVHAALGSEDLLVGHDLGWLRTENVAARHEPPDHFWGYALTLLVDRYDLGELRFTDVDRNLLVASSNQNRVAKSPIAFASEKPALPPVHYSKSETDIVGEFGMYKNDQTASERVRLLISHEYI